MGLIAQDQMDNLFHYLAPPDSTSVTAPMMIPSHPSAAVGAQNPDATHPLVCPLLSVLDSRLASSLPTPPAEASRSSSARLTPS